MRGLTSQGPGAAAWCRPSGTRPSGWRPPGPRIPERMPPPSSATSSRPTRGCRTRSSWRRRRPSATP
eukprot:4052976-Lingulodinium_polyedra.AAC.1